MDADAGECLGNARRPLVRIQVRAFMIEKALRKTKAVGGSLMISLPSSWCREQAIAAGDFVRVKEQGNKLVLSKEE
jgi:hypothetical protein